MTFCLVLVDLEREGSGKDDGGGGGGCLLIDTILFKSLSLSKSRGLNIPHPRRGALAPHDHRRKWRDGMSREHLLLWQFRKYLNDITGVAGCFERLSGGRNDRNLARRNKWRRE